MGEVGAGNRRKGKSECVAQTSLPPSQKNCQERQSKVNRFLLQFSLTSFCNS
jgi:hypothetical protein